MIKALILDLDNTVYPVRSVSDQLFASLYELFEQYKDQVGQEQLDAAKNDLLAKPFQQIADKHGFPEELKEKSLELLRNLTYDKPMQAFEEYTYVRSLPADKFLVTTGFTRLQQSKVKMLGVEDDFKKIVIVDPDTSEKTKGDIFQEIMNEFGYKPEEVLVVGDDPESEIKYGASLGIPTFLYDPENNYPNATATVKAKSFKELKL